jgi:hypothetical protein
LVLGGKEETKAGLAAGVPGSISIKGRHQALVAAFNGQITKLTSEVEDMKKQIDQERER